MWASRLCHLRSVQITSTARRFFASITTNNNEPLVSHTIDTETNIAIVTLQHPPVNALSSHMCQALTDTIQTIELSHANGLVLRSSSSKIFCAGLDLNELYQPDVKRLELLWNSFQQLYMTLYGSRLACVAAMEGHAPAGACMVALCCDYRILASNSNAKMGLNETKLGIGLPFWLVRQMMDTIGPRKAEMAMSLGTLFSAQEALEVGLVDELVEQEVVLDQAMTVAKSWSDIPAAARAATKEIIRRPRIEQLEANRSADTKVFVESVLQESTQRMLGEYLKSLGSKK